MVKFLLDFHAQAHNTAAHLQKKSNNEGRIRPSVEFFLLFYFAVNYTAKYTKMSISTSNHKSIPIY